MPKLPSVTALVLVALAAAGCDKSDPLGCATDKQCPAGSVCLDRRCELLCQEDRDCTAGQYCNGEICVTGDRQGPRITAIDGSGSTACTGATGKLCLGEHLVVIGQNLGGSSFRLVRPGGGADVALSVPAGGRVQNDVVDLAPTLAGALVAGEYVLVASNSAGEDQAGMTLLQGEPGPDADGAEIVTRINASTAIIDAARVAGGGGGAMTGTQIIIAINDAATSGLISADRVAGGGGGGASLHLYDNSTTVATSGFTGDRMVVKLNASTSAVQSLAIDNTQLHALCADDDGCQVSLATIGWHFAGQPALVIAAPYVNSSCRFFIKPGAGPSGSDAWAVSASCAEWYGVFRDTNADGIPDTLSANNTQAYIPYYSGAFGNDGSADESLAVLHNRACYLTESAPTGSASELVNDTAKGFYLVASHPTWAGSYWVGDAYWPSSGTGRSCSLIVED